MSRFLFLRPGPGWNLGEAEERLGIAPKHVAQPAWL